MKCNDREKLFLFVHQMLQPEEAEAVRRHLAGCADCVRAAGEYHRLEEALNYWRVAEPSPWFDARIRDRVAANGQQNLRFFGFPAVTVAVAVMVLILAGVVVFSHRGVVENQQPLAIQQQPVATAAPPQAPSTTQAGRRPLPAEDQLKMDENLRVLEDYEVVANFDALSELPQANDN